MQTVVSPYDVLAKRADFPVLNQEIHGRPLAYLDNAASAQKPQSVIDVTREFYSNDYANVHRGVHTLSQRATDLFEATRDKVRIVLNARETAEVIYTKGCTEGINLVAQCWARDRLKPGDEILLTEMEHHSNIVPWQIVAEQTGAKVVAAPIDDRGEVDLEAYEKLLSERTKIAAMVHISNSIGTINPVEQMVAMAKRVGATTLVDGAQAGPHHLIDVQAIGCDFYTLSCHKMYAPTGVGILWGRRERLDAMPPYQGGGSMIRKVTFAETTYADLPDKFEPGTPNIAGFVGYGAAIEYMARVSSSAPFSRESWTAGIQAIAAHEARLTEFGTHLLQDIPGLRLIGTADHKAGILSFVMDMAHAHDVGHILDSEGVAVRVGHHCCQPLMARFGVAATVRASLGLYTTETDLVQLAHGLKRVGAMFA